MIQIFKYSDLFPSLDDPIVAAEEPVPEPTSPPVNEEPIVVNKILLVNTENVKHDEYTQTPELKVWPSSRRFYN